jgi:hypothetical protein
LGLSSQLAEAGIVKNVIAHCLAGGNRGGGSLFFGDDLVPSWGMTWAPKLTKHDEYVSLRWYYCKVDGCLHSFSCGIKWELRGSS